MNRLWDRQTRGMGTMSLRYQTLRALLFDCTAVQKLPPPIPSPLMNFAGRGPRRRGSRLVGPRA